MILADLSGATPLSVACGCLVWVVVGGWVMYIITWTVHGDIDLGVGFIGVLSAFMLGAFTTNPPHPSLSPILFLVATASLLALPFVRSAHHKRTVGKLDIDRLELAYGALDMRPDNPSAQFKIAETVYSRGLPGHAIALAESALSSMPKSMFLNEHRAVESWKMAVQDPNAFKPIQCPECSHWIAPGGYRCPTCRTKYLLSYAKGQWIGPSIAKKVLGAWIVAILALVGIPSTVASHLPTAAMIVLILAQGAIGIIVLVKAFKGVLGGMER